MPTFGSFGDLGDWHANQSMSDDLSNAVQLAEFGNGQEAVRILDTYDLDREPAAKKPTYGFCYYRAAKEALADRRWKVARRLLAAAVHLGHDSWRVQRRLELLGRILRGTVAPEPSEDWLERYRCQCEMCTSTSASLLDCAKCQGILDEPCKPVYQSHIDDLYAVGVYRWAGDENSWNALSRMMRLLKNSEGEQICKYLGWLLVCGLREEKPHLLKDADVLIPVPADPGRTAERGFDNVVELCTWVEVFSITPIARDAMRKIHATPDLRHLSPSERRRTISGSMQVVDARQVRDSTILLLDDVVTSGSTLDHCAEVLLDAGAAKVYAATIARSESTQASAKFGGA